MYCTCLLSEISEDSIYEAQHSMPLPILYSTLELFQFMWPLSHTHFEIKVKKSHFAILIFQAFAQVESFW